MWFQVCRGVKLPHIWVLLWSMQVVESSLRGFVVLEDSMKMRFVRFLSFHLSTNSFSTSILIISMKLLILPSLTSLLATECLEIQLFYFHSGYLLVFYAWYCFQQLISGVSYCHSKVNRIIILWMSRFGWQLVFSFLCGYFLSNFFLLQQICDQDLKLKNTLLDGSSVHSSKFVIFVK